MNIKKIRLDLALPATVSPLAEGGGALPPPAAHLRGERGRGSSGRGGRRPLEGEEWRRAPTGEGGGIGKGRSGGEDKKDRKRTGVEDKV